MHRYNIDLVASHFICLHSKSFNLQNAEVGSQRHQGKDHQRHETHSNWGASPKNMEETFRQRRFFLDKEGGDNEISDFFFSRRFVSKFGTLWIARGSRNDDMFWRCLKIVSIKTKPSISTRDKNKMTTLSCTSCSEHKRFSIAPQKRHIWHVFVQNSLWLVMWTKLGRLITLAVFAKVCSQIYEAQRWSGKGLCELSD